MLNVSAQIKTMPWGRPISPTVASFGLAAISFIRSTTGLVSGIGDAKLQRSFLAQNLIFVHVQGAWEVSADETKVTFHASPNPTNEEIAACVEKIARGTLKILKRMALLETDEHGHNVIGKSDEGSDDPLANIQAASTQNKIALGSRRGQRIRRLLEELEVDISGGQAEITGPLVATHAGFSLHAGVSCWSTNKARLEQLIRYTARPAVSEERLSEMENGDIHYKLKKPWTEG